MIVWMLQSLLVAAMIAGAATSRAALAKVSVGMGGSILDDARSVRCRP